MPKRGSKRRTMKGGDLSSWFNDTSSSASSWFNNSTSSASSWLTSAWNKTKNAYSSTTGTTPSTTTPSYGGKKRRRTKRMRGGNFTDNTPTTGLASHAGPISDIKTAQPHNWVGGRRTRKHKRR
jgi:hypothetical protein